MSLSERTQSVAVVLLFLGAWGGMQSDASAASQVHVGKQWPAGQRVSMAQIDHTAWNSLLQKYVDAQGFVDYVHWKSSRGDVRALDNYLASLSRAEPSRKADRASKMAFWINAYNAVTLRGILREYPTSSIRNHTPKLFGYNIWDDLLLTVGSRKYALRQIENDVLRKMGDPRVHFAIVCASIGCPRLMNEAYTASQLDEQLTTNAKEFFANRLKFHYNASNRTIQISPILKWYAGDFGANTAAQMRTIAPYLPTDAARKLASSGSARVSYLDYDWGLNDQSKRPKTARRR